MIDSESSKLNIENNDDDDAVQLEEQSATVQTLPSDYIPSYVGLSCVVSGYRPINKYDGATLESSSIITPRFSFLCGHCKDNSSTLYNEKKSEQSDSLNNVLRSKSSLCTDTTCLKEETKMSSGNINHSQFARLNSNSGVSNSTSIQITKNVSCFSNKMGEEKNMKSFVQQRIERLYGPTALSVSFQSKKSFMERLKDEERLEGEEDSNKNLKNTPEQFPSVFRHLRPEFRHQLPVKSTKIATFSQNNLFNKDISNGCSMKQNLDEINNIGKETTKSWKSLSKELENVGKSASQHSSEYTTEKQTLTLLPLKELTNNDTPEINSTNQIVHEIIKDGNYFLELIAREIEILESQTKKIEVDLNLHEDVMSEDVKGKLLAASGKAKLLTNQKLKQFQGLCFKNINTCPEDDFPTTNEDLAGFWDMVQIQVDHVKGLLQEVERLRRVNWQEISADVSFERVVSKKSSAAKKPQSNGLTVKKNGKCEKQDNLNDERRKQMRQLLNAKRKQINEIKCSNDSSGDIEIFVHHK